MEPKCWTETMDKAEVAWCQAELRAGEERLSEPCCDNFRAARIWKSSQRRRFRKQEAAGCCGSTNWIAKRWSERKQRYDLYLLGFNFGH